MDDLRKKLTALIVDKLCVDEHDLDKNFLKPWAYFDADSLDLVELIMGIETHFDVSLDAHVAEQMITPQKTYELLLNLTNSAWPGTAYLWNLTLLARCQVST